MRFHVIEPSAVILRSRHVFKQVRLFYRREHVYAEVSGGYILMMSNHGTGHPAVYWDEFDLPFQAQYDNMGRMLYDEYHDAASKAKQIEHQPAIEAPKPKTRNSKEKMQVWA